MKHPADEVYAHVTDSLTDEDIEHLSEGVDAFFRQVFERSRVEVELHSRQSRACPWEQ